MLKMLMAVWSYRSFIVGSVGREFQLKYRNSLLGALWTVVNPLAMITVYTVVFSELMKTRLPGVSNDFGYSIFLCAGILTWNLFSEIVGRAQTVFIDNANMLKKLAFPRMCLPVTVVLNALMNFSISFGIFLLFLWISGNFPGVVVVASIPLLMVLMLFAIGLGVALGVLNVFFRDVGQFFGIVLTFWFWLTPIVYPISSLSEGVRAAIAFNPMVSLFTAFQEVFISGMWPDWLSLWPIVLLAISMCFAGLSLFRRRAGEMVDEL